MPWRITLTVRAGRLQGSRWLGASALGGARRLPGAILRSWALHPGAIGQGQQGGHRQDEPVPGDAGGVGAPRLVPLPAQALEP